MGRPRSAGTRCSYLIDGTSRRTRTCSFLTTRTMPSQATGPLHFSLNELESQNAIFNVRTSKSRLASTTSISSRPTRAKRSEGSWNQGVQTISHEILTKKQEVELGQDIKLAKLIREDITFWVLEEERLKQEEWQGERESIGFEYEEGLHDSKDELNDLNSLGMTGTKSESSDLLNGALDEMGMHRLNLEEINSLRIHDESCQPEDELYSDNESDVLLWDDVMLLNNNLPSPNLKSTSKTSRQRSLSDNTILTKEGAKLNMAFLDQDLELLSPQVIATQFTKYNCTSLENIQHVLARGSRARNKLIRSNLRLVLSISKKVLSQSNVESMPLSIWYMGSWDRPSLDEVVQEGVLGLVRAVDKWEWERDLKFGTYATHWITSFVKMCLQQTETGCLKIPSNLHSIKTRYKQLRRKKREMSLPMPPDDDLAIELGVTAKSLQRALTVTTTLVSLDDAISSFNSRLKGSSAGESSYSQKSNTLGDILEDSTELKPEDYVNRLLLRQALENAMAVELSPHERDILRLRNGLEDGKARTVKEVVKDLGGILSMSDVRNVERKAFAKLRNPTAIYTHGLLAYLEVADINGDVNTFHQ